jgi:hypothetical protein
MHDSETLVTQRLQLKTVSDFEIVQYLIDLKVLKSVLTLIIFLRQIQFL